MTLPQEQPQPQTEAQRALRETVAAFCTEMRDSTVALAAKLDAMNDKLDALHATLTRICIVIYIIVLGLVVALVAPGVARLFM